MLLPLACTRTRTRTQLSSLHAHVSSTSSSSSIASSCCGTIVSATADMVGKDSLVCLGLVWGTDDGGWCELSRCRAATGCAGHRRCVSGARFEHACAGANRHRTLCAQRRVQQVRRMLGTRGRVTSNARREPVGVAATVFVAVGSRAWSNGHGPPSAPRPRCRLCVPAASVAWRRHAHACNAVRHLPPRADPGLAARFALALTTALHSTRKKEDVMCRRRARKTANTSL